MTAVPFREQRRHSAALLLEEAWRRAWACAAAASGGAESAKRNGRVNSNVMECFGDACAPRCRPAYGEEIGVAPPLRENKSVRINATLIVCYTVHCLAWLVLVDDINT
jgi:hypothetical protein